MTRSEPSVHLRRLVAADTNRIASRSTDEDFCRAACWSIRLAGERQAFQRRLIADPPADLVRLAAIHDAQLVGYVDLHGSEPDVSSWVS